MMQDSQIRVVGGITVLPAMSKFRGKNKKTESFLQKSENCELNMVAHTGGYFVKMETFDRL